MKPVQKIIRSFTKIVAIAILIFVIIVVAAVGILNTSSFQNKFLGYATEMLQEKLQTKVEIGSIHIGFFNDDVRLNKLRVEDLQHRKMLDFDYLAADIDMWALLHSKVELKDVTAKGLHVQIFKERPDTTANYQFVLDAFKKEKKEEEKETPKKEESGKKLTFDLKKLGVEDVDVVYNDSHFSIGTLNLRKGWGNKMTGKLHKAKGAWINIKKQKQVKVDNQMMIDAATVELDGTKGKAKIDSLHWVTDNHLPHKRAGNPKRGWFDDGHMNMVVHAKLDFSYLRKDSICGKITKLEANDKASGLHITDLNLAFKKKKDKIHVSDATINMANTTLKFTKGEIQMGSKKKGTPFHFSTSDITGTTMLTDISQPFAPMLKDFKLPLNFSTKFSGDDTTLFFKDVTVNTTDNKFYANAVGRIEGLKDKNKTNVHFDILKCVVQDNSKERIINQFHVKKFMMKQLHTLGTLRYKGSFDIRQKQVEFHGDLGTACGNLKFSFLIDGLTNYLSGNVESIYLDLGKAMDYPDLGNVIGVAAFKIDISKARTGVMRKHKGGKLPFGEVNAVINEVKHKKIKLTDIYANIVSDGAVAEGKINKKSKLADIMCAFTFTDTNEMKKTKIKPSIHFNLFNNNKKDDSDKAKRKRKKHSDTNGE